MSIKYYQEDVSLPELAYNVVSKGLKSEIRKSKCKLGDINYIFCSDDYLLKLNVEFLNHHDYTDVITFDYSCDSLVAGDIYISTDRVLNNSEIYGQLYTDELLRVISHGLLHLLKYNDKTPEDIVVMRRKEVELITKINSLI